MEMGFVNLDYEFSGKPFDGQTSFLEWKMFVHHALAKQGFHDIQRGIQPKLESSMSGERLKQEALACAIIRLSLAPKLRPRVWKETSATAMMEKLERDYKANSALHSKVYWKKLYGLKMEEGTDVHSHVGEFQFLVCELEFLGEMNLDEEDQALLLLKSLLLSFEPVKRILSTVGAEKLTINRVRDGMMVRDCKLQMERLCMNKPDQTGEPSMNTDELRTGFGIDCLEDPIHETVYCQWKSQIESLLALRGFHDILQGIEQNPESMTEDDWSRLDAGARLIILNVTPKLRLNICEEDSAKAMLDKIEEHYKSYKWGKLLRMKL